MTSLALRPESSAVLARMLGTAEALSAVVDVLPLESQEDERKAAELLRAIATLKSEGESARKGEKEPHLRAGQAVDEHFRPARAELDRVEGLLRRRLAEVAEARERARRAAQEAARAAVAQGDHAGANAALADITMHDLDAPRGVSHVWDWEMTSVRLAEVPESFIVRSINMEMVRAEVARAKAEGRDPCIPGVVFEKKATVRVRKL